MTDRRFGAFRFGEETFGPSDNKSLAWGVEVDWDQDGFFDGTNEASRMIGISVNRGRVSFVKAEGNGFEPIATGVLKITLDNSDDRYNGFNTSSPLYPYVTYGGDIRIRVRDLRDTSGTIYDVFYGTVYDVKPSGFGGNAKVAIYARGPMEYLRNFQARVPIQKDIDPSDAIGLILDYIGWPDRYGRGLETTTDSIKYFWASGSKLASSTVQDITSSFLGYFFASAQGKATYVSRVDVSEPVVELDESELSKDISFPQPFENKRNITRIKSHPRTLASTGVIWQLLGNTPSVQPGASESLTVWADYTYNDVDVPADAVVTPVATTDYTMNSQPDGSGSDLTSDLSVGITDFGDSAKLVLTNSGAGVGYVTKLQVRGDAIYEQNRADVTYPDDITVIKNPRELSLDLIWQQDINVANDFSDLVGPFMDSLRPYPVVKIDTRAYLQFAPELFDIVILNLPTIGVIGRSYRVAGIKHDSNSSNCQHIVTTFYLEPYISFENFWTFPIADFGVDTRFGA